MMKILVVGCGAMGSAMIQGWLCSAGQEEITVHGIAPHPERVAIKDKNFEIFTHPDQLPTQHYDLVLFAVKPYLMEDILPLYKDFQGVMATVAAGKLVSVYEAYFPQKPFFRIMPNTPVAIGEGALLVHGNSFVTPSDRGFIEHVLKLLGTLFWLENESLFNAGTAITGCGPAYFFLLAEYLQREAERLDFSSDQALDMTKATFKGAALYANVSEKSLQDLRHDVARPGGMTEKAVNVLQEGLEEKVSLALQAAIKKGESLS